MSISITHESYSFLALATISEDEKSPLKSHNMGATQEAVTLFFRKGDQTQRPWFGQTRFQLRGSTPGLFRFPGLEKQKHACFGSKFRPLSPLAFNSHVEDHIAMTPEHGMKVWVFALLFFHLCIVPVVSVECRPPLMEQPSNSATELFARLDGFVQQPSLPTGPEPELMNEFAPFSRLFPSFIDVHCASLLGPHSAGSSKIYNDLSSPVGPNHFDDHADDDSCPSWSNQRSDLPDLDLPAVDGNTQTEAGFGQVSITNWYLTAVGWGSSQLLWSKEDNQPTINILKPSFPLCWQ